MPPSLAFTIITIILAIAGSINGALAALPPTTTTILIETRTVLARTDPTRFASFSFDFTSLFGVQRTFIPFTDARLRQYARNLAPAYVRFGGSLQDRTVSVFAGVPQPAAAPPSMLVLALNESVFDGLVNFADATGLDLVYGLNAAVGRQTAAGGSASWDAENALAPVVRAAARGFRIPVVELGNEVNVFNCSKDGSAKMSPAQLAAQYAITAATVRELLPGTRFWGSDSSITGDVVGQCHDYFGDDIFGFNREMFAQPGWSDLIDAYSWHYYSQDSRNVTSTASLILSDEYQARLLNADSQSRALRDAAAPGLPILLGETASFWAGGKANVSNRFASGFYYLPQLANLASRGYLTHIRQDLAGGDYGMVELVLDDAGAVVDFSPNPDYFSHALWQRLVSGTILLANVTSPVGAPRVHAWAACGARAAGGANGGITIIFANFDATPAPVTFAFAGGLSLGDIRHEYILTAGDAIAGLASSTIRLNDAILTMGNDLLLPPLTPFVSAGNATLVLPQLSYGFLVFPLAQGGGACGSSV